MKKNKLTMRNISHKNILHTGALQIRIDIPLITLIKSKLDFKTESDYLKNKLCRNHTSEKSDMCEF